MGFFPISVETSEAPSKEILEIGENRGDRGPIHYEPIQARRGDHRASGNLGVSAAGDEGIWLPNQFPSGEVQKKYGTVVYQDFLDRLRLASVRVVASASFVSPNGLLFTNHHMASECIQQLSSKEHDYMKDGFYAASVAGEKRCPGMEADVLLEIEDVTGKIVAGVAEDAGAAEASKMQRANTARIEKECTGRTGNRCEVVTLYSGGQYHLYQYRKYDDVRLVFAPESSVAAFGGTLTT